MRDLSKFFVPIIILYLIGITLSIIFAIHPREYGTREMIVLDKGDSIDLGSGKVFHLQVLLDNVGTSFAIDGQSSEDWKWEYYDLDIAVALTLEGQKLSLVGGQDVKVWILPYQAEDSYTVRYISSTDTKINTFATGLFICSSLVFLLLMFTGDVYTLIKWY